MPLAEEYQAMLAQLAETPGPQLHEMSPADARAVYQMMRPAAPEIEVAAVRELSVDGPHGPVPLRVYTPAGDGPFGVFMNFHGGGWVIGDLETADAVCRELANAAGVVVVSVDYRLAPEHPYPAAVDDCWAATCWAAEHAAELNGSGKLAVGGESAGGNLAAVMALRARDAGGPSIDLQLLAYPVVDHDLTRGSYAENGEGYILTADGMRWFWDTYCPDPAKRAEVDASPLLAGSHAGLPPAVVLTAEFDPLRDEGAAYAERLNAAGTTAELVCYDGLVHDFLATARLFQCSKPGFDKAVAAVRGAIA